MSSFTELAAWLWLGSRQHLREPDRRRPPNTYQVPDSSRVPGWGWLCTPHTFRQNPRQIYQVPNSTKSSIAIRLPTLTIHCSNNHRDLFRKAIAHERKTNASFIGWTFWYYPVIPSGAIEGMLYVVGFPTTYNGLRACIQIICTPARMTTLKHNHTCLIECVKQFVDEL